MLLFTNEKWRALRLSRLLEMKWWVEMDSNQRKLTLADLQSAPFSHSGIYPFRLRGADVWGTPPDLTRKTLPSPAKTFGDGGMRIRHSS